MFRELPRTFDALDENYSAMRSLEAIHNYCTMLPLQMRAFRKHDILVHKLDKI